MSSLQLPLLNPPPPHNLIPPFLSIIFFQGRHFFASPYPERHSAWFLKDLALQLQLFYPSDAVAEECKSSKYNTSGDKEWQCSGGLRICDLIKQHTNTLLHLCRVGLQRMARRREDLPNMAPACLVGTRGGKDGYTYA